MLLVLAIDLAVFGFLDLPLLGILRLPAVGAFFEVFVKDDGEFVLGGSGYRAAEEWSCDSDGDPAFDFKKRCFD